MRLLIRRTNITRLYTEGILLINGRMTSLTVEDTLSMLSQGDYDIRLSKGASRRRVIAIVAHDEAKIQLRQAHHLRAGGSYLTSRRYKCISIGQPLIPGALKQGRELYDRLFDRIEKAEARKEPITLGITEEDSITSAPIAHWDQPTHHDCPPSKRNS